MSAKRFAYNLDGSLAPVNENRYTCNNMLTFGLIMRVSGIRAQGLNLVSHIGTFQKRD